MKEYKVRPMVVSKNEQLGCCFLWALFSIAMVVGLIMVV